MSVVDVVSNAAAGVVALALLGYLVVAMVRPEKF